MSGSGRPSALHRLLARASRPAVLSPERIATAADALGEVPAAPSPDIAPAITASSPGSPRRPAVSIPPTAERLTVRAASGPEPEAAIAPTDKPTEAPPSPPAAAPTEPPESAATAAGARPTGPAVETDAGRRSPPPEASPDSEAPRTSPPAETAPAVRPRERTGSAAPADPNGARADGASEQRTPPSAAPLGRAPEGLRQPATKPNVASPTIPNRHAPAVRPAAGSRSDPDHHQVREPEPPVVIDRIEVITPPARAPEGDPFASLAARRTAASRHGHPGGAR